MDVDDLYTQNLNVLKLCSFGPPKSFYRQLDKAQKELLRNQGFRKLVHEQQTTIVIKPPSKSWL